MKDKDIKDRFDILFLMLKMSLENDIEICKAIKAAAEYEPIGLNVKAMKTETLDETLKEMEDGEYE